MLSATVMIAQQVAGKATRDALFLSHFEVTRLPVVLMAAASLSFVGVLVMSRLLARFSPAGLVPVVFALSAAGFLVEWALYLDHPQAISIVLYLHMGVFGGILISGFWSVVNERFDPHAAKRTIARVAAAATLGGVVGGVVAERVASVADNHAMLWGLALMHLLCALAVLGVGSGRQAARVSGGAAQGGGGGEVLSGFKLIKGHRYLQQMALLVALVAAVAALLDYALKAEAVQRFDSAQSLTAFFASFYAFTGVAAFFLQTLLGPRILQQVGLGGSIRMLPATVLLGGIVATAVTHLWTVVALRGAEAMLANSFFRSAFELLYTPLAAGIKRPTKAIIDVAASRVGDVVGGGMLLVLLWALPELPTSLVISLAMGLAGLGFVVAGRLNRGYVEQLAISLRLGSVSLDDEAVVDATTRGTLAQTRVVSDREMLARKLAQLSSSRALVQSPRSGPDETADPLLAAIADLTCGDIGRMHRALTGKFMDTRLVPFMVPLLAHPELGDETRMELRWLVPRIVGQLGDALTDPDTPLAVRQRLPEVLEIHHSPRAVDTLLLGLQDGEFPVRFRCVQALARMLVRGRGLKVSTKVAFAAAQRELEVDDNVWELQGRLVSTGDGGVEALDVPLGARIGPSLYHVFSILGLALDREALQMAMHALVTDDRDLRGTALEYLEHVLPQRLRRRLWPRLEVPHATRKPGRPHQAVVDELLRAARRRLG